MVFLFAVWIECRCAVVSSYDCCGLSFRLLCGLYAVVLLFQTVFCVWIVCCFAVVSDCVLCFVCGLYVAVLFFSGCDLCFCSQSGLYATVPLAVWIILTVWIILAVWIVLCS